MVRGLWTAGSSGAAMAVGEDGGMEKKDEFDGG
jgi:hypothetical protein